LLAAPFGALIGGWLFAHLADRAGFGWVFAVAGGAWLIAPLCWPHAIIARPPISAVSAAATWPYRNVRTLIRVALLLMSAVFAGRMTLTLAIEGAGLPGRAAGEIAALGGLVMLGGLPLIGRLADRFGAQRILAGVALSAALGCSVLISAQDWALLACAGILLSGATYGAGTLLCVCAVERAPGGSGGAAVMLVTATFWGAAVLSFLGAGTLADRIGLPMLAGICAALAFAAAATLLASKSSDDLMI
jgi:predicted MFS family arabinose efflux permease